MFIYSEVPPNCGVCHELIPGERAGLACGHLFHIKCALDHFSRLGSEDRRTCPTCHFQVKTFIHSHMEQEKPLRDLGREILCEVVNPEYTVPPPEMEYKSRMLTISIKYIYIGIFGSHSSEKEGTPIEIDSTSTLEQLKDGIKDKKEYRNYYEPSFLFNKKELCNDGKLLEDMGLISGSTIVVKLSEPQQD